MDGMALGGLPAMCTTGTPFVPRTPPTRSRTRAVPQWYAKRTKGTVAVLICVSHPAPRLGGFLRRFDARIKLPN